jgi:hypothetical protein
MYKITFNMEKEIETLMLRFGAENVYECLISKLETYYNLYNKITNKVITQASNIKKEEFEVEPTNEKDKEKKVDNKKGDQYKQKQRAEQKQKREENLAKGIEPESLLTKENLEQWIGVEGRTCAHIAAKIVGCKEEDVSTLVKAYKIKKEGKNIAQKVLIGKKTRGG